MRSIRRWNQGVRQRALIAVIQVLSLSVWFSATAVVPSLRSEWGIGSGEAVWLTASVQVGFVVGAIGSTLLNLADRVRPQLVLGASAFLAAGITLLFAVTVDSLSAAIPLRFATGVCLAGVYPVGMKVTASWARPSERGRAFGILLGALTLGTALPHLIGGLGSIPWRSVMTIAALLCAAGGLLAITLIKSGPYVNSTMPRPNPRYALAMFLERGPRLANIGYFGHMWELYALWTWMPAFILASQQHTSAGASPMSSITAFVSIGIAGIAGCLLGGWASDRFGRPISAFTALAISGLCCLLSPVVFGAPWIVLVIFLLVWGSSVIADSGVFSTSLSEQVDPRYVGTALTTQTAIGFMLTVGSIQLVPVIADAVGWRFAFLILALGPIVGAPAMLILRRIRGADTRSHSGVRETPADNLILEN
ncbi:Sugar phosphate permease [Rhodococcus pyridinivorans]|nr:Sugar phosphate permease [Rhodococcus pyridinivorans]